jgi:hypothetical protein
MPISIERSLHMESNDPSKEPDPNAASEPDVTWGNGGIDDWGWMAETSYEPTNERRRGVSSTNTQKEPNYA